MDGTLLPPGDYAFPFTLTWTPIDPKPPTDATPPNGLFEIVGPAGGGPFNNTTAGYTQTIGWDGTQWLWQIIGPRYNIASVPLVWDAGDEAYLGTIDWLYLPSLSGAFTYNMRFDPTALCVSEWLRVNLDVRNEPAGEVYRYNQAWVPLVDTVRTECRGGTNLWESWHQRGLVYKAGSQAGPRATGQIMKFFPA